MYSEAFYPHRKSGLLHKSIMTSPTIVKAAFVNAYRGVGHFVGRSATVSMPESPNGVVYCSVVTLSDCVTLSS